MTRPCPSCHQPNVPEAVFCHNCAAPLIPVASPPPPQNQPWPQQASPLAAPPPASAGGGASQRAIIALVLTIVAFVCCGPFTGIPAAILGWMELDAIAKGQSPAAGKWMAQVGLWGGIGFTVLHVVIYIIYVVFTALAVSNPYAY
ncbi:MAG: hypothetical protein ABJB40_03575 [Acidobacteriota bacterium]